MISRGLAVGVLLMLAASAQAQPVRDSTATPRDTLRSAPSDPWLGRDKALHAGGSLALTLGGTVLLTEAGKLDEGRALPVAAGTTLALGVMKELTDRRRTHAPLFSWRDLVADAVGIGLAALIVSL